MTGHGITYFNVLTSELERIVYHGKDVDFRLLHRSDDGRQAVFFSSNAGSAIKFTERPANLAEAFYVIEGTITCTREGGETIVWGPGDLVHWPYEKEMALEYSADLKSICFFWSDEELPEFDSVGELT